MEENFDPFARAAATQGLRGAYDGSEGDGFSSGGSAVDTSWVPDGYGFNPDKTREFSLDNLFGGLSNSVAIGGPDLPTGLNFNKLLPGQILRQNTGFGRGIYNGYNRDGAEGDLRADLEDLVGTGVTSQKAYDVKNPYKWYERYTNSDGKVLGDRYGETSHGFLDKYSLAIGKGLLGAGLGFGAGAAFGGAAGATGGTGLSATAAGGGTGAGMSVGAATGGTGAGLGSGAFGAFGSGAASAGGALGGFGAGLGEAGARAAINTLLNGGDFGKSFLSNYLTSGLPTGNMGDFGDYTDIINKVGRRAAAGFVQGGGEGALMGAANPLVSQGLNQVSDYFSNMGNQWDQDSFGSGGMSMGAPQPGTLQGYFNGMSQGGQQGPMSTTQALQNGSGGANSIDWEGVLNGSQGFGNTNPQEGQQASFGSLPGMQGQGFMQMPFNGGDSLNMSAAPNAAAGSQGWSDDYAKQIPDALKAVMIARYPQLRGVLGGGARMSPVAAGAGALATLYSAHKNSKALDKQQGQLNSLFGQNSSYSKAMREQLARQDAKAGRRSQYGPREVELQARLAQMNGQLAPQRFALSQAQDQNRIGMLGQLLQYSDQSGLSDYASKGLEDFFKNIG